MIKSARGFLSETAKLKGNMNQSKTYLQMVQASEIQNESQKSEKSNESLTDTISICPICLQVFFLEKRKEKILLTASSREQKGARATYY